MWNYFFVMLWLLYMLSAGIHIFSRGFMLSRQTLQNINECQHLDFCDDPTNDTCLHKTKIDHIFSQQMNESSSARICLPKKSKVILLVIDALKYDFGLYDENIVKPLAYQNRMPIFHDLLTKRPKHSRLLKFIADPPTTTLQRINGLTTGSLPTFIDVGSNFASPEINEDNIIDQMLRNNLTAIFMGDSTWTELFPRRFKRAYSYPSFDIYDLDTVDRNIEKILPKELEKDDWDVLVAHFLGVDHCGHKHGPMHHEMTRKLFEMNKMIGNVIENMDNYTTLYVIGDHGMTATGDHGGDTEDETNALLFAYSSHHEFHVDEVDSAKDMKQIDLVPTLSTVLGIPIPFSNLGQINYNLIPDVPMKYLNRAQQFLLYSLMNIWQIRNYEITISASSYGFIAEEQALQQTNAFNTIKRQSNELNSEIDFAHFHRYQMKSYLTTTVQQFYDVWVKFDANQMSQGLLFVSIFSILLFLLIHNAPISTFDTIFSTNACVFLYVCNFICAIIGYWCYSYFSFETNIQFIIVLTSIFNILFIAFRVVQDFDLISVSMYYRKSNSINLLMRLIFIFSISVFFSNSFIIAEQTILRYILTGLLFLLAYSVRNIGFGFDFKFKFRLKTIFNSILGKLFIILIVSLVVLRASHVQFRCREEQGNCTDFNSVQSEKKTRNRNSELWPIALIIFFVTFTRMYLKYMNHFMGKTVPAIIAQYGPVVSVACISVHFVVSRMPGGVSKKMNIDGWAWVVYLLAILQFLVMLFDPLLVCVQRTIQNSVPQVFNKIKSELDNSIQKEEEDEQFIKIPWTYGLTSVYSGSLISLGIPYILLVTLLLGPNPSSGVIITVFVAVITLLLSTYHQFQTENSLERCLQPKTLTLIIWSLLAHYGFYLTSHQPTLSQIDWHAAFVGQQNQQFSNSNIISAILVLINTFGITIILFMLYPLLCIFGFGLYSRLPNWIIDTQNASGKKALVNNRVSTTNHDFDLYRGELNLYENSHTLMGSVFKTGCQLMIFQASRVFCSMLACTIHCRHLMVWKIFAPRFIYEGIASYLSFVAIVMGYALVLLIHRAVEKLLKKIVMNPKIFNKIDEDKPKEKLIPKELNIVEENGKLKIA